jgi:hypothetical protein
VVKRYPRRSFDVTIHYREPSYEQVAGRKEHPYRWTFRLSAVDETAARDMAVDEFRETERLSGVGWIRQIASVEVRPV